MPNRCPSFSYWSKRSFDRNTPALVQQVDRIEESIHRLILMTGSEDLHAFQDVLEELIQRKVVKYKKAPSEFLHNNYSISLPLRSLCSSLTVTDQSSLAVHIKAHAGIELKLHSTIKDYLAAATSVSFRGDCNAYERELLLLETTEFLTNLDLIHNAELDPTYLPAIHLEKPNGEILNVLEYYPTILDFHNRVKSLNFTHEMKMDKRLRHYNMFLKFGQTAFVHDKCYCYVRTNERTHKDIQDPTSTFLNFAVKSWLENPLAVPDLKLFKNLTEDDWRSLFPYQWHFLNHTIHSMRTVHDNLTPEVSVRLSLIIDNYRNSKSYNEFAVHLMASALAKSGGHKRKKRAIMGLIFKASALVKKALTQLYIFFKNLFNSVLGNKLIVKSMAALSQLKAIPGKVPYVQVLRSQFATRRLMNDLGPYTSKLLKSVKMPGQTYTYPAFLSSGRKISFSLPKHLPSKFVGPVSSAGKGAKKRLIDTYTFARKYKWEIGANVLALATFGAVDGAIEHHYHSDVARPDNDTLLLNPDNEFIGRQASSDYDFLTENINGGFTYGTPLNSTMVGKLQDEVYPDHLVGEVYNNETYDPAKQEVMDRLRFYYIENNQEGVDIFDQSIDINVRRQALDNQRRLNQRLRYQNSVALMAMRYPEKDDEHRRAYNAAQAYFGLFTMSTRLVLPAEADMDMILDSLALTSKATFIDEMEDLITVAFMQLREHLAQTSRNGGFDIGDPGSIPGMKGESPLNDLDGADSKEVFVLMLRQRGDEIISEYVRYLDLIIAAENERMLWISNNKNHELLYKRPPGIIPSLDQDQDFLFMMFSFLLRLNTNQERSELDRFLERNSQLTAIRMIAENEAVGLSTEMLRTRVDEYHVKRMRKKGLSGSAVREPSDSDNFVEYNDWLELAMNSTANILEFMPSPENYREDSRNILSNEFVGQNRPSYAGADNVMITDANYVPPQTQEARNRAEMLKRVKRQTAEYVANLTSMPEFKNEVERLLSQRDGVSEAILTNEISDLQEETSTKPYRLSIKDMMEIHHKMNNVTYRQKFKLDYYQKAYLNYLKDATRLVTNHEVDPVVAAMLLEPINLRYIHAPITRGIQAAHVLLHVDPLPRLSDRQVLQQYIEEILEKNQELMEQFEEETQKVVKMQEDFQKELSGSLKYITVGKLFIYFGLILLAHALVVIAEKILSKIIDYIRCYLPVAQDVALDDFE